MMRCDTSVPVSTSVFNRRSRGVRTWREMACWCRRACVCLLLSAGAAMAAVPDSAQDAYLAGQLAYFLERELGWERSSYRLDVRNGVATITLPEEDLVRRTALTQGAPAIDGLKGVNVVVGAASVAKTDEAESPLYSFLGLAPGSVPFPVGDLFLPLLADPKQPQFFTSYRYYRTPQATSNAAAVGYGETFGIYRQPGRLPGNGLQVGVSGALFAQFNLDAPSADLINADYTIGFPVTWRNGSTSARLRIYHQSSHLGDEYLLNASPERINLSFESVELLVAEQSETWRVYFGGEYLIHREPADLKRASAHGGIEFRTTRPVWYSGHWVGGVDVKAWEEHDWSRDVSVKVGLEFGAYQPGQRRVRLMLEGYDGYAPHGQFYSDHINYYGLGLYLGF